MAKIVSKDGGPPVMELSIKRFCAPYTLSDTCPECGSDVSRDFTYTYMSYPTTNKATDEGLWCEGCGHEWTVPIIVALDVRIAE